LPLRGNDSVRIDRLPIRHRDPFRSSAHGAIEDQLAHVTMDADIAAYAKDGLTVIGKK
jgi:hypothetical protein